MLIANTSKSTPKLTETLDKQLVKQSISGQKILLFSTDLTQSHYTLLFFFFLVNTLYGTTCPRQALI